MSRRECKPGPSRTLASHADFDALRQPFGDDLGMEKIHASMRGLWVVLPTADDVRSQGCPHLKGGPAENVTRAKEVARPLQPLVERVVDRVRRKGAGTTDPRNPQVLHRRKRDNGVLEIREKRVDSGIWRCWRRLIPDVRRRLERAESRRGRCLCPPRRRRQHNQA